MIWVGRSSVGNSAAVIEPRRDKKGGVRVDSERMAGVASSGEGVVAWEVGAGSGVGTALATTVFRSPGVRMRMVVATASTAAAEAGMIHACRRSDRDETGRSFRTLALWRMVSR